ncbi:MAG: hypothetical protein NT069_17630 [Planctomycetota bacterium]|nr:hypothetical protein [Planctomycetota bacterium]
MRSNLLLLAAAALLLPFAVGCSSSRVVRGQGPGDMAYAGSDNGYCESDDCDCDECSRRARHQCRPYHVPHDLSYPPAGAMPAVVQYPYYTNKGPDCFFYDSDGKNKP